jgi:hypothetical protein
MNEVEVGELRYLKWKDAIERDGSKQKDHPLAFSSLSVVLF